MSTAPLRESRTHTPRQHAGSTDTSVDVQHEDIEGVNHR
jgi:hypothetical protein